MGSSQTKDHVPCVGRWILNHCDTREVLIALLMRTLILLGYGLTFMILFNLPSLEVPSPNTATLGVRASTYELGGTHSVHNAFLDSLPASSDSW